jgi:hypothetical protein
MLVEFLDRPALGDSSYDPIVWIEAATLTNLPNDGPCI